MMMRRVAGGSNPAMMRAAQGQRTPRTGAGLLKRLHITKAEKSSAEAPKSSPEAKTSVKTAEHVDLKFAQAPAKDNTNAALLAKMRAFTALAKRKAANLRGTPEAAKQTDKASLGGTTPVTVATATTEKKVEAVTKK